AVFDQGRSRADLHTGPATDTIRRQETVGPHPGRDAAVKAPPLDGQRKSTLHLFAGPDATRTDDAFRRVEGEIGVRLILGPVFGVRPLGIAAGKMVLARLITHFAQTDGPGHVL